MYVHRYTRFAKFNAKKKHFEFMSNLFYQRQTDIQTIKWLDE